MRYLNHVTEAIGNTPLVKLNKVTEGIQGTILAKVEYFNPGNSVKDRMAIRMIVAVPGPGVMVTSSAISRNSGTERMATDCSAAGRPAMSHESTT